MYYIIYKKNIHMNPSKVTHETLQLCNEQNIKLDESITVLGVSTLKFNTLVKEYSAPVRIGNEVATCAVIHSEKRIKL